MKVLNYTTSYFAFLLLLIISIWAGVFYYAMLDEIYDSIDDGLDNRKGLILQKIGVDSSILTKAGFNESDYSITEVSVQSAQGFHDVYRDTLMYMQNEQDFEPVRLLRTAFHHQGKYYQMQVITSMVEEDDLVSELFYALLWLYLGLIATILILNNFLLKKVWKPFYHLLQQVKNFRLERPFIQVKKTNIDEFRLLNEAVQKMLQSNVDSYNSQKHFIENASHELQTPLAIAINKLEALAETSLSEEAAVLLTSALDNLERLTRLNRSLLLLSKIENRQFLLQELVSINELVKKAGDDFSDQLAFSKINLELTEEANCSVMMNPDLAAILVNNLIKNAIVHNHPRGSIQILVKDAALIIKNTSETSELDQQALFTRFHKEKQSKTSTGLGLAIVKAIADLFHLTVTYSYDEVHIVEVRFPR